MKSYTVTPVATVIGGRVRPIDDNWGAVTAIVRVDQERFDADALAGLEEFSHLEVVYTFHLVDPAGIERGARRPRNDPRWPRAGIFAQRARDRPNRIGVSRCRITRVSGLDVHAEGLDAVDGTPVLDIKPHMSEFDRPGTSGRASLNASAVPQTPASEEQPRCRRSIGSPSPADVHFAAYLLDAVRKAVAALPRIALAESALHAPFASFGGVAAYPDLTEQAAVLLEHLVKNHPLPDANKRAGLLTMARFLHANGLTWGAQDAEVDAGMVERIAAGEVEHEEVVRWVRARTG